MQKNFDMKCGELDFQITFQKPSKFSIEKKIEIALDSEIDIPSFKKGKK